MTWEAWLAAYLLIGVFTAIYGWRSGERLIVALCFAVCWFPALVWVAIFASMEES